MRTAGAPSARWSPEEFATLDRVYPEGGMAAAQQALPNRNRPAIYVMANKRGLASPIVSDAPRPKLRGDALEEAIRLREEERWSFERIGKRFGVAEASACNAVLIALCSRKGFTPAERDHHGRLTDDGRARVRLAMRRGMKGVDIQLQLGVSASCVAEQRRRYRADLKGRGKAPMPPANHGQRYSGVQVPRADVKAVEQLLLEGYGSQRISERTGVSNRSIGRIRNRLIKRLARRGETIPGCDKSGRRSGPAKESRHYLAEPLRDALRTMLLDAVPVQRAATELGIGHSSAYKIRDALAADLATRGEKLPVPVRGSGAAAEPWLPRSHASRFRALVHEVGPAEAKRLVLEMLAADRRAEAEARAAERARPKSFEEQLARVARGEAKLVANIPLRRPGYAGTLGGVATGAL